MGKEKQRINRLKAVLAEIGMTQEELAEKWGRDKATISRICNQHNQFRLSDLPRLSQITGVPMDKFISPEIA